MKAYRKVLYSSRVFDFLIVIFIQKIKISENKTILSFQYSQHNVLVRGLPLPKSFCHLHLSTPLVFATELHPVSASPKFAPEMRVFTQGDGTPLPRQQPVGAIKPWRLSPPSPNETTGGHRPLWRSRYVVAIYVLHDCIMFM